MEIRTPSDSKLLPIFFECPISDCVDQPRVTDSALVEIEQFATLGVGTHLENSFLLVEVHVRDGAGRNLEERIGLRDALGDDVRSQGLDSLQGLKIS